MLTPKRATNECSLFDWPSPTPNFLREFSHETVPHNPGSILRARVGWRCVRRPGQGNSRREDGCCCEETARESDPGTAREGRFCLRQQGADKLVLHAAPGCQEAHD